MNQMKPCWLLCSYAWRGCTACRTQPCQRSAAHDKLHHVSVLAYCLFREPHQWAASALATVQGRAPVGTCMGVAMLEAASAEAKQSRGCMQVLLRLSI